MAMRLGEDIEVKGAVSEKLYFNLTNSYMKLVQLVMPALKEVNITPESLDDGKTSKCEGGVVTGFSAGVDSFFTLYNNYFNCTLPTYKITHLVFNNVGSHDAWNSKRGRELFNARYDLLKDYPRKIGLDFIKIDSNLTDILRWNFLQTHVPRNISAVLMLQKLFGKYYYSSSLQYKNCFIEPDYDISRISPLSIHLLSTETLDCILAGSQYSRVEKTKMVAKVPEVNQWLNVCVEPPSDGKNCSVCPKCCRTLLTLEILGVLDDFDQVFDLDKWKKFKNSFLISVLGDKKDPFIKEIRDYAKSVGYSFKPWYVVASDGLHFKIGSSGASLYPLFHALNSYIYLLLKKKYGEK
jgi:hypothetical protein